MKAPLAKSGRLFQQLLRRMGTSSSNKKLSDPLIFDGKVFKQQFAFMGTKHVMEKVRQEKQSGLFDSFINYSDSLLPHRAYFDGACLSNGSPDASGGSGAVIVGPNDDVLCSLGASIPHPTNNRCEFLGLMLAILMAKEAGKFIRTQKYRIPGRLPPGG